MIELIANNKSYSDGDINILINKDGITGKTELQFFTGDSELRFNDENAEIKISIEIASDDDLSKLIDGSQNADMSIDRINQALAFIRRELDVVRTRNEEAFKLYRDLCGAAFVQE